MKRFLFMAAILLAIAGAVATTVPRSALRVLSESISLSDSKPLGLTESRPIRGLRSAAVQRRGLGVDTVATSTPTMKGTSYDNPYTVDEFIAFGVPNSGEVYENTYVKGYIVGCVCGNVITDSKFSADGALASNVLIASNKNETDYMKCVPVNLPSGTIRDELNLSANPANLGAEVILVGSRMRYFNSAGLKKLTGYQWVTSSSTKYPTLCLTGEFNGWGTGDEFTMISDGAYTITIPELSGEFKISTTDGTQQWGAAPGDSIVTLPYEKTLVANGQNLNITSPLRNVTISYLYDGNAIVLTGTAPKDYATGSLERPLLVAEYIAGGCPLSTDKPSYVDDTYVKGYIVGYVDGTSLVDGFGSFKNYVPRGQYMESNYSIETATNIMIADSPNETEYFNCIPVSLTGDARTTLNLWEHPENFQKEVTLCGRRILYMGVTGLKNVTYTELKAQTPTPEPTPEPTPITPELLPGEQAVFFENTASWSGNINCYSWTTDGSLTASWPGNTCQYLGNNIWKYTYPADMQTLPANTGVIFNNVVDGYGRQTANLIFVNGGYYDANGYVKTISVKGSEPEPTPVEWRLMYHGIKPGAADFSDWKCNETYHMFVGSSDQSRVWGDYYDNSGVALICKGAENGIYDPVDYSAAGYTTVEGTAWREFDFTNCTHVKINFDHIGTKPVSLERCLRVKCDSIDDKIAVSNWSESVWTSSGDIDLSAYAGKKVSLGFYFSGDSTNLAWWEVNNVKVYTSAATVEPTPDPDPTPEPEPTPTYPELYINYGYEDTMVAMTHQGENVYTVEIPRIDKSFYISTKDRSIEYGGGGYNVEPSDSVYHLTKGSYKNYLKVPTAILNAKLTFNLTDATLRVEGRLDMPELFINYGSEETRVPMTYVSKRVYTVELPRLENKFVISSADPTKICYGGTLNIAPSETTYRLVSTSSTWNTNPKYLTVPTPILNAQLTFDFSNASLLVSGELLQPDPDDRIITVTVENPGELQEKFLATEGAGIHTTVWLEVHGPVNDTDLLWCSKIKHLKTLNLWNAETTSVPANFMKGSTTLQQVSLPKGVTTIGSYALSSCPALGYVAMGREVQNIGSYVLAYSTALQTLKSYADVPPTTSSTFMYGVTKSNVVVYIPMTDVRTYLDARVWKDCNFSLLSIPVDSATIDTGIALIPDYNQSIFERKPDINLIVRRGQSSSQINYGNLTINTASEELDSLPVYGLGKVKFSQIRDCRDGNMQSEYCPTLRVWRENMTAEAATTEINFRKNTWHFLSFPYDVKVSEIVNPNASDFVIRRYDSAKRASGEAGSRWTDVGADETLKAGEGYILQTTNYIWDSNTGYYKDALLEFPATAETATRIMDVNREVALTEYPSEKLNDRSWNLVGNPFPCYYDLRKSESLLAPIVIWRGSSYQAYSMEDDHVILRPNEAFFLQKPEDLDKIEFSAYGTYTIGNANYVVDNDGDTPGHRIIALDGNVEEMVENPEMGAKTTAAHRHVFNFHVEGCGSDDRARIVLNEEASPAYEAARDAEKFFADRCTGVEMYVSDGVKYDICERPMGDGLAALDLVTAQAGEYTFSLKGSNMDGYTATLIDTATGAQIDLTGESYKATLPKGTTAGRFQIRFRADDTTFVRSLMAPDTEVTVCTLNGVTIYTGRISDFSAEEGLYIVKSADKAYKVIVK